MNRLSLWSLDDRIEFFVVVSMPILISANVLGCLKARLWVFFLVDDGVDIVHELFLSSVLISILDCSINV